MKAGRREEKRVKRGNKKLKKEKKAADKRKGLPVFLLVNPIK